MPLLIERIEELSSMKKYPITLHYRGNKDLLNKVKISVVGTRKPSKYTRQYIQNLTALCTSYDICVVSGGAMGVDASAHIGAGSSNTIGVLPCGIDIKYPSVNKNLLQDIESNGLLLSQFEEGFKSRPWSFVTRNELVVALGKVLVVGEADLGSGSMRSIEYALEMKKDIYVLPQRLGESEATNKLVEDGKAKVIYNLESFVKQFSEKTIDQTSNEDPFLDFCKSNPSYETAVLEFPERIYEAELYGQIEIRNGKVFPT